MNQTKADQLMQELLHCFIHHHKLDCGYLSQKHSLNILGLISSLSDGGINMRVKWLTCVCRFTMAHTWVGIHKVIDGRGHGIFFFSGVTANTFLLKQ